jgi:hypothetical protein
MPKQVIKVIAVSVDEPEPDVKLDEEQPAQVEEHQKPSEEGETEDHENIVEEIPKPTRCLRERA